MKTKTTQRGQADIVLTLEEKSVIYGSLLGDAHLQKRGNSFRLKVAHGITQKQYVMWKYEKLERLCQLPKEVSNNKGLTSVEFYTSSGAWLRPIYERMYKKDEAGRMVKTISEELIKALPLTPLLLAVFYMDDGSIRDDCFAGKLATQGFSKHGNKLLKEFLAEFNVNSSVVKQTVASEQYYLSLPAATFGTLVNIIKPIVSEIESMVYKIKKQ